MRVPGAALAALLACLAPLLAGCTVLSSACDDVPVTHVVDAVEGNDLLIDDRSLVLHAVRSEVYVKTPESCARGSLADVRAGDRVGHDADQVADSFPAQAWPKTVVVERVGPSA